MNDLLPELLKKRVVTLGGHHYLRVRFVNDYLHFLKKGGAEQKAIRAFMEWATPEEHKGQVKYKDGLPNEDELLEVTRDMQKIAEGYNACRKEFILNAEEYIKLNYKI